MVKLLGIDAFNLLFGRSPAGMTGALEGFLLGGAVGLGAWLASRTGRLRRGMLTAALTGGIAGLLIPLAGGRLMAGSLNILAQTFPGSRLRLDQVGIMIVDDAVIRQAMEFAASALKLKPDAVPDISKVRDWSYASAATAK